MPSITEYSQKKPIKMLFIGESGKGKTGGLASLVQMGFKLRVLDFDNGMGILVSVLNKAVADGKMPKEFLDNVIYESCLDAFVAVGNKLLPKGTPTAFVRGLQLLTKWKTPTYDLGAVSTWGKDTILVIDTLSHLSNAAMQYVLALNNRSGEHPYQSDWGQAMDMIEGVLKMLYSDEIKCHVIVNAHITFVGEERNSKQEITKPGVPHPNTLGQKLPPKVGQYFNTMLQADTSGFGANAKRIIRTATVGELAIKSEILGLPKELPLESGLADFFKLANQLPKGE